MSKKLNTILEISGRRHQQHKAEHMQKTMNHLCFKSLLVTYRQKVSQKVFLPRLSPQSYQPRCLGVLVCVVYNFFGTSDEAGKRPFSPEREVEGAASSESPLGAV